MSPSTRPATLGLTTVLAVATMAFAQLSAVGLETLGVFDSALPDDAREVALRTGRELAPAATRVTVARAVRREDCAVVEYSWGGMGSLPNAAFVDVDGQWRLDGFSTALDPFDVDHPRWDRTCH